MYIDIHFKSFWCRGCQTMTETLPGVPHQEADAGAPFHSRLGSVILSQSVDWPWANWMAWALSHVATVGGRLNDCENFKKDLSGGAVVLCAVFPTALPLPACRNPGSPTPKTTISGVATFPPGTRPSPSQKGEDPRVPWSQAGVGSPFIQGSRGVPLRVDSKNWKTTALTS